MKNKFPILGTNPREYIPLDIIKPHENQAILNHSQTLERLAERGGLGWIEALCVLEDREYDFHTKLTEMSARIKVLELIDLSNSEDNKVQFDNIDELYEHIKQESEKTLNDIGEQFKLSPEDEEKLDILIKNIMEDDSYINKVYNDYCIVFSDIEDVDNIRIKVEQKDRPNGADDEDIIREYILNNYGYRDYIIVEVDMLDKVVL